MYVIYVCNVSILIVFHVNGSNMNMKLDIFCFCFFWFCVVMTKLHDNTKPRRILTVLKNYVSRFIFLTWPAQF